MSASSGFIFIEKSRLVVARLLAAGQYLFYFADAASVISDVIYMRIIIIKL